MHVTFMIPQPKEDVHSKYQESLSKQGFYTLEHNLKPTISLPRIKFSPRDERSSVFSILPQTLEQDTKRSKHTATVTINNHS